MCQFVMFVSLFAIEINFQSVDKFQTSYFDQFLRSQFIDMRNIRIEMNFDESD